MEKLEHVFDISVDGTMDLSGSMFGDNMYGEVMLGGDFTCQILDLKANVSRGLQGYLE